MVRRVATRQPPSQVRAVPPRAARTHCGQGSARTPRHRYAYRALVVRAELVTRWVVAAPGEGLQPDGLVDELVGDDVLWRQALLGRGALGGVDRHGQLDQLADPIGVELAHHAVGPVGHEAVLLDRL